MYRLPLALACCVTLLLAASRAHGNDWDRLQGDWIVESFVYNSEPVERMQDAVRRFTGDKYKLTPKSGDAIEGSTRLDAEKQPKQIDLEVMSHTLKGIYEVEGDVLKMAYRVDDDQRPTEFASPPDSGVILVIHKRAAQVK